MVNPTRDKKQKARTGGEKGRHLWPRLFQEIAVGKTSYELGWEVKVMNRWKKGKKERIIIVIGNCLLPILGQVLVAFYSPFFPAQAPSGLHLGIATKIRREKLALCVYSSSITGDHSKQHQILLVKIGKYIVFCVCHRSYQVLTMAPRNSASIVPVE